MPPTSLPDFAYFATKNFEMRIHKILFLFLLVIVSCKTNKENEQLRTFVADWSQTFESQSRDFSKFYDPTFRFPKDIFKSQFDGIKYSFKVDSATINKPDGNEDILVNVPFQLSFPDGTYKQGATLLTIRKTESGFLIRRMSPELAMEVIKYGKRTMAEENPEYTLRYDSIVGPILASAKALSRHYDSVVYYARVDNVVLFYVVKGNWINPYPQRGDDELEGDRGDYIMGVVTSDNKVIIPVEYSKVYNPNGSFDGMIEVENKGAHGLFYNTGGVFIPAEYDGVYPTRVSGAMAQVKKGDKYGWVDKNGKVSFDPDSHANKLLFQSPVESRAILDWEFRFPGPICLLRDIYGDINGNGIIVYPSYVQDFGLTKSANPYMVVEGGNEYGWGTNDLTVKFEKVETISDKLFGVLTFFMEAGVSAREYHTKLNDLLVVDKNLLILSHLPAICDDNEYQDPCGMTSSSCRSIEQGLFESHDGHGKFKYFRVSATGAVDELKTDRQYNFTKFAFIDERYFDRCESQSIRESANGNMMRIYGVDLDVMRNEIFAEYGFIFKSPKWKEYFLAKPWYKPRYENVDKFLTEKDKANIKFIQEYKALHKDYKIGRDTITFWAAG